MKKTVKSVKNIKPVYEYVSQCCNVAAKKDPLVKPEEKAKSPELGPGLGKWHCTACRKVAKVKRQKPGAKLQTVAEGLASIGVVEETQ